MSMKPSTVVALSAGTAFAAIAAYAVYFDHKRRTDPEFRKSLKREARRQARAAKEEAEAHGARQRELIKEAVAEAKAEGFPTNVEEKEAFFMEQVHKGENMAAESAPPVEAALCFYKALKVYPQPRDLIPIYDKSIPKPILDILAEMIAVDPALSVGSFGDGSSDVVE
ncbi:MAG: hypothetical protein M1824_001620 [Vezdaea acicularis]|nr:MAG: hypothetical protein M1824_001620 [Vezdaea acicularis]